MKNLFKNLMLVAVAAMAFTACTEEQNEVNAVKEKVTITFTADFGEDTRVSLDNSENPNVYKAAWEAGDVVTFVVFENAETNTHKEISNPITIATAGDTAEFTVTFNNGLVEGNVIKAYVNYSVYEDYYGWFVCEPEWYQSPSNDGPSAIYASASVVYQAGIDYTKLSFTHDYAYGLMTIESFPTELSNVDFIEFNIDGKATSVYTDYLEGGDKVWFYCDEDTNVEKFQIRVVYNDFESEYFFSRSFNEEGQFAFKQGRVSRFTVSTWKSKLAQPEVEATVSGKTITLNWASVEGADGYRIEITDDADFSDEVSLGNDAVSYEFTAPLEDTYYYFSVYACANEDNESYITSQECDIYKMSGNTTPAIILSPESLSFTAEGGEQEVEVTLANIDGDFTYTVNDGWITVTPNDNILTVSVAEYTVETEDRTGYITISAGELTKTISVNQSKKTTGSGDEPVVNNGVFDRFVVTPYPTYGDVEVRFFFYENNTSYFIYVDFQGCPLESKTYTASDFNYDYSGGYVLNSSTGTVQMVKVESANIKVQTNGDGTYSFVGTITTDYDTYDVSISGTSAIG